MQRDGVKEQYTGVTLQKLGTIGSELIARFPDQRIWIFHGDMGSGKTTLIKTLCRQLGVEEGMSSPTFALVNEYQAKDEEKVYHFDFYRLKNEWEAAGIGVEEYFYSGKYCFIEWPDKILSFLPPGYIEITIKTEDPEHRLIEVTINAN